MKKLIGILMALVLVLGLVACGNDEASSDEDKENEASSSADADAEAAESVVGMTFELYKTNYGEEKEAEMEIIYTFKEDDTVDVVLGGSEMNKPFSQDGANVTIDFGANGGIEELVLIDGELVKDLGYGTEYFRKK